MTFIQDFLEILEETYTDNGLYNLAYNCIYVVITIPRLQIIKETMQQFDIIVKSHVLRGVGYFTRRDIAFHT